MRFITTLCMGLLLLVSGAWGAYTGVRAGRSQIIYARTKFAKEPLAVERVLQRCESAQRTYQANYYFADYAATRALDEALSTEDVDRCEEMMRAADHWSIVAVRTNPFLSDLSFNRCRVLEKDGRLGESIALWRGVVEQEFWNPDHHAYLARLLLGAGDLEGVESELKWTRGSRQARHIRADLKRIRERRKLLGID